MSMEKELKLYKLVNGQKVLFPSEDKPLFLDTFTYTTQRMGGTPSITASVKYERCLDEEWDGVFAEFNGERYYVKTEPNSSKSNDDARFEHAITLYSERFVLDNTYFIDAVQEDSAIDKYKSNSTKVLFMGDIAEFASRLSDSMAYAGLDYTAVVDEGITTEHKLVSFENKFISEALQEAFNIFEVPYYFVGKVIHFGYTSNAITTPVEYGADEALMTIQKNNANYRIVTRCSGTGSEDNIPYYYPNLSPKGEIAAVASAGNFSVQVVNAEAFSNKVNPSDEIRYKTATFDKEYLSAEYPIFFGQDLTHIQNRLITDTNNPLKAYVMTISNSKGYWQKGSCTAIQSINVTYAGVITIKAEMTSVYFRKGEYLEGKPLEIINVPTSVQTFRLAVYSKGNDIAPLPYEYFDAEQLKSGVSVNIETAGEYYVSFQMVFDDSRKVTSLDHIQYYVYPTVSLEVASADVGWLLNGEITSLSSLGLAVSGNPKSGDRITQTVGRYIQPSKTLMPPIFRETRGAERFYNAISGIYPTPEIPSEFYDFANEYTEGDPREQVVSFENIKPTIKGMTNASGQPIDKFLEFAWDADDNDDIDPETGEYYHPYFFAKLPKFDGPYGFNLFDSANENGEMAFSMTSGVCGGCEFSIGVGSESQKNIVQVDANGNLERDSKGNVKLGDAQDKQNDTIHNEVWIALKKEENTYPVLMPSLSRGLVPTSNDTFVILYINLPQAYITAAEHRLYEEIIKYMKLNNDEKFTFTIGFSRIFFAQNPEFLAQLNENARLLVRYNEREYTFYISTFKYAMTAGDVLPNISVDLVEELTTTGNSLQQRIDAVKQDILASVGGADVLKTGLKYFLRKDIEDVANEKLTFLKGAKFGKYSSGFLGGGGAINVNPDGSTTAEFDFLKIRRKAEFAEITIDELKSVGGTIILSNASMICSAVETLGDRYRCYFQKNGTDGRDVVNQFAVGDLARCQTFATTHTKYYWRQVVGVGDDYIDLSVDIADENSDIPSAGDIIVQLGNTTDVNRQSAQILSCYGNDAPSFIMLNGINSFSLSQKDIFGVVFDQQKKQPMLYNYGSMLMGSRDKSGDYITFDPTTGKFFIKAQVQFAAGSSGLNSIPEWNETIQNLQNQIDGVVQTWFSNDVTPEQTGEPLPSKDNPSAVANYPVNTWAAGTANQHLGDLYYSNANKAYRFQKIGDSMVWSEIPDSDITKVLEAAKKASEDAAAAKKAAEAALEGAKAANERLSAWASDGKFSPAELTSLADELVFANSEKEKISPELQRYGIDATNFNSSANAYIQMLQDITSATPDKDGCVPVPDNFSTVHQAYYTQRTVSLNAISIKAKEIADTAKDTADQAATDAATALNAAISGVDVEYAQNMSNTVAPTDGWTTVAPAWKSGYYIWQRTKTSYANGKLPTYSEATCISGADGQSGTSVTITSTEVRYAGSASNTTAPTTGWNANPPAVDEGNYLWTRTKVTYSDGTTTTAYSVAKQGQSGNTPTITISGDGYWVINGEKTTTKAEGTEGHTPVITIGDNGNWWIDGVDSGKTAQGKDGVGISGVTEHYGVSKDASTRPTSWTDVIPATYNTTNKYLWNYETIHYTVGEPVDTEPAIIGVYGKDGKEISSIVEHYQIGSSPTTAPANEDSWPTVAPVPTDSKRYLWNYEVINYTEGDPYKSTPAIIGVRGQNGSTPQIRYHDVITVRVDYTNSYWPSDGPSVGELVDACYAGDEIYGEKAYVSIKEYSSGLLYILVNGTFVDEAERDIGQGTIVEHNNVGFWYIGESFTRIRAESKDGNSPEIGDNGHWFVGGVDTGVEARGSKGNGISAVEEYYAASTNGTTAPSKTDSSLWTKDAIPSDYDENKRFLWNYERIVYTIDDPTTTVPAVVGVWGKEGKSGRGIASIVEHYAIGSSNTSAPTTGWSDTFVAPTKDKPYLWNYETINYTEGNPEDTNKAIIGMRGADGNSITVKNTSVDYAVSDNVDNIPASSNWGERPTTIGDGKYLWTRTIVTYSDDTSTTSYSYARQGTDGSAGVGVESITELYYMTAKTTKPSKPTKHVTNEADAVEQWTKKCPTWIAGCVYYTCSEIKYDDKAGHYAWTDVQIDTNYRSRTFYTEDGECPTPPYNIGDQWACANGTFQTTSTLLAAYGSTLVADDGVVTAEQVTITIKNELLVCINPKAQGEKFDIADWTPSGGYGKKMDYQYLVDCLPQGSTTDVYGGLVLGNMIGVKNEDGMVVAFMNGLETQSSLKDATYGTLMFASGVTNGVANAKNAATQIWSDGTLISTKGKFTNAEIDGKITARTGKIGNFDITSGGWLIATSDSSDWNFELRFSAASFNVESSNVTFESTDYQHKTQTAQGEAYVPIVCTYGADFFISAYGSSYSMPSRHAVLDISSNVSYASGKTPEFRNIGIRLDVTGASDIYYGPTGECGGNYAIYCDNGMFAGLRPKTVKIVNSTTLTVLDYNVIAEPTANITITFPSSVRIGQTYRIFKPKTSASKIITVSTGGKSIRDFGLRYNGVNNLEVSGTPLDASKWGVVEYVFDGTYWNKIIISVYDYYYDPNIG